jgi:transaldolase
VTRLHELYDRFGQSVWLDNLERRWLASGELARRIVEGVRGITSNPTIFAKAMAGSDAYDAQIRDATQSGAPVDELFWQLAEADVAAAADLFRPLFDASAGLDGYVSLEVDPTLAGRSEETVAAGRRLFSALGRPNVYIKVPATPEGVPAIRALIGAGINVNVTLIFSLDRHREVMEAYLAGLEDLRAAGGSPASVASVASFFVSRVDSEVDRRLDAVGTPEARALRGKAAIAQAQVAYQNFRATFAGPRWDALAAAGARLQRPLWASTSTKDPDYPDTMYVDELIGPDTVNTMPEPTMKAFESHGRLERTVDRDPDAARATLARLGEVGVDLDDVVLRLEHEGVAAFAKSLDEVLDTLSAEIAELHQR